MAVQGISSATSTTRLARDLISAENKTTEREVQVQLLKKANESQSAVLDLIEEAMGVGQNVDRRA